MNCAICASQRNSEAGLCCPSCARAALFPLRIQHAEALLDKERLGQRVESIVRVAAETNRSDQDERGVESLRHQTTLAAVEDSKERIKRVVQQADVLKRRIEQYKREVEERQAAAKLRRMRIHSSRKHVSSLSSSSLDALRKKCAKGASRHESVYGRVVSSRTFLCREAANLAGLQQQRREAADGSVEELYTLGGVPVIDLGRLNSASPRQVTTSLANVSRLLALVCNYLDVRLPAELTVPHSEHPFPTIFAVTSSYSGRMLPAPVAASSGSPRSSRTLAQRDSLPRPRPLSLDRKLPVLAKDDPGTYSLFIEGVSFLAWDIAWLCRTQGLPIASTDWEEFCAIGRNLWLLLVAAPTESRPGIRRNRSSNDRAVEKSPHMVTKGPPPASLGVYSHGSNFAFLGGPGSPYAKSSETSISNWRFSSPTFLNDKLKAALYQEMSGAEWELLDTKDYSGFDGNCDDELVLLGSKEGSTSRKQESSFDERTSSQEANAVEHEDVPIISKNGEIRPKGSSGWTKLKSRGPL